MRIFANIMLIIVLLPSCSGSTWLTNSDVHRVNATPNDLTRLMGIPISKDSQTLQGPVRTTEYFYLVVTKAGIVEERIYYYRIDSGRLERFSKSYNDDPDPEFRVLNSTNGQDRKLIEKYWKEHPHLKRNT